MSWSSGESYFGVTDRVFKGHFKKGQIDKVQLIALEQEGFCVVGMAGVSQLKYILTTRNNQNKVIKNIDTAHSLLLSMGISEYRVISSLWEAGKVYNPHKSSLNSRKRNNEGGV